MWHWAKLSYCKVIISISLAVDHTDIVLLLGGDCAGMDLMTYVGDLELIEEIFEATTNHVICYG